MPILGLIDSATFANAVGVTINSPTVTKNAADEIAAGDIIVLGGVRYFCLLYTSPSPRDATLSRMPSSA